MGESFGSTGPNTGQYVDDVHKGNPNIMVTGLGDEEIEEIFAEMDRQHRECRALGRVASPSTAAGVDRTSPIPGTPEIGNVD